MNTRPVNTSPAQPWWRFGIVWLVLSGPAAVVLASIVTAWVAWHHIDPVITESSVPAEDSDASNVPALKARNHVATPRRP